MELWPGMTYTRLGDSKPVVTPSAGHTLRPSMIFTVWKVMLLGPDSERLEKPKKREKKKQSSTIEYF
ncbi:hypothetical protein TYRP_023130 [Tyrophagus putrescentiae]|nr:hypothetical protein TYRP_023130 [Tyrophagus putrescentiae]